MRRHLPALADGHFDLLIIGGGIMGAGAARDAALRGLRVALIDKSDFASGTSSQSSKLIHGGFRYLEQYQFHLVAESCRERRILQEIAPDLVHPIPFLLPVYEGDPRSLLKMRLGMTLYDLLALYRNTAPHRALDPDHACELEPGLARDGLRGAIRYYDCQEDDARLCIENVMDAARHGAACANYCELTALRTQGSEVIAAQVKDRIGGGSFDILARAFINAAGPWIERISGLAPDIEHRVSIGPTKGVHILLPRLTREHAIAFQAKHDGRILFVLPWLDGSIVGTTDTVFRGDADDVHAEPEDIAYLLSEVRRLIPHAPCDEADVITSFAGLRPLLRADGTAPSSRSREHRIARQGSNFLTLAGGKYTTYRAIAEEAVNQVYHLRGQRPARCLTATTPLPSSRPPPTGEKIANQPEIYASDVVHACRCEMAMTVEDVMRRRTRLALSRNNTPAVAAAVERIMAGMIDTCSGPC